MGNSKVWNRNLGKLEQLKISVGIRLEEIPRNTRLEHFMISYINSEDFFSNFFRFFFLWKIFLETIQKKVFFSLDSFPCFYEHQCFHEGFFMRRLISLSPNPIELYLKKYTSWMKKVDMKFNLLLEFQLQSHLCMDSDKYTSQIKWNKTTFSLSISHNSSIKYSLFKTISWLKSLQLPFQASFSAQS